MEYFVLIPLFGGWANIQLRKIEDSLLGVEPASSSEIDILQYSE